MGIVVTERRAYPKPGYISTSSPESSARRGHDLEAAEIARNVAGLHATRWIFHLQRAGHAVCFAGWCGARSVSKQPFRRARCAPELERASASTRGAGEPSGSLSAERREHD